MFIKKDSRKIFEILCDPKEGPPRHLKIARRAPEFPSHHTGEVICEGTASALADMTVLSLYDNKLKKLQNFSVLAGIGKLEELNVGYNQLTQLPSSLGDIESLRKLFVEDNLLSVFPVPVLRLVNLTHLRLSGNTIEVVPDNIDALTQLEEFAIDANKLVALPESLGNLTMLRNLVLRGNSLTALPESIGQLTSLTALTVTTNALRRLPRGLGSCKALATLILNCNALVTLPSTLARLPALRLLNVAHNAIQALPLSLVDAWAASLPAGVVARAPSLIRTFVSTLVDGSGQASFAYRGHAGKTCLATVSLSARALQRLVQGNSEARIGKHASAVMLGDETDLDGAMEVIGDAGEGDGCEGLWPADVQDLCLDADIDALRGHDMGQYEAEDGDGDEEEMGVGAGAGAVPSSLPVPSCLSLTYIYQAGVCSREATGAYTPQWAPLQGNPTEEALKKHEDKRLVLNIDVNPLLNPACGVGALSGGDMLPSQYREPLVLELRKRMEDRARAKQGGSKSNAV